MPDPTQSSPDASALNGAAGVPSFATIQSQFGGIPMTADEIAKSKADLFQSEQSLQDLNAKEQQQLEQQQQPAAPPQRQPGLLDRLAPLLLISAFSGKAGKMNAGNALAATVGATRGYLAGDQQNYEDQQARYGAAVAAMKQHYDEQDKIYQLMRESYKDRIDGDIKALQFARQVTNDETHLGIQAVDVHNKVTSAVDKLNEDWQKHVDTMKERDKKAAGSDELPPDWTPEKTRYYAEKSYAGDNTWRMGLSRTKGGVAIIKAVDAMVPDISKERGSTPEKDITRNQVRASLVKALNQRQQFVAASNQFVSNFQKQADLVEQYAKAGTANSGASVINAWVQAGRKATSDPAVRKFDMALNGLVREHMRIVTGVTSNAQLHIDSAKTGDKLLNDSFTSEDVSADLQEIRSEARNALQSGKEEVGDLITQLETLGTAPDAPVAAPAAAPVPVDDILKKYPPRSPPGG